MKPLTLLSLVLAAQAALFSAAGLRARAAEPKPNFVFIFIDDLGYGDIGPFGSTKNRTPALDRMAREGMKLTSFYAAPVCTPSRAQVLTGCYAKRVSLPRVIFPACPTGLNAEESTIAELLKAQGYATMCIGKWHVGDQPEFLPTRHGFDRYFGIPYSNDMGGGGGPRDARPPLPLVRDETVLEEVTPEGQDRLTERYTEAAVSFIAEHRERPLFLYFPHTAVHTPLHPGAAFKGKSGNGTFGDWVEEVDGSVGRVLDALRQHKLAERTLVIFSSDNGPWLTQGANGGVAGPLRGGKGGTYEGGMREPTLAWWPGHVPAGSVCDAPAANFDLLPTFVGLAGGAVPPGRKIDGRDIAPLLLGKSKESPHEAIYYFSGPHLQAVRSGPWKLAVARQNEATGKKEAATPEPWSPTLYNLDDDIGERTNVYEKHPEIVKRLQGLIDAMAADLGAGEDGPGVRPPGRVEKPVGMYLPGRAPPPEAAPEARPTRNLKAGDTFISERAPQVAGRPFRVEAEFDPGSGGVIVAHGGITMGYALYVRERRCSFAVRTDGQATIVTSPPLPPGRVRVEAELERDGAMTLAVDGKPAASGRALGLIPRQPAEPFCCGFDSIRPVADYGGDGRFAGTLFRLVVEPR